MNEITVTNLKCPLCGEFIISMPGHQVDPTNGITVECRNKACTMADWGHSKNEKEAFEIFKQKCGRG